MRFNNFKAVLLVRVALLIFTIGLLVNSFYSDSYTLTKILLLTALGFEIQLLIKFLDKTNRELSGFLNSIKYDDFSHTYTTKKTGTSQDDLYQEFNNVIKKFREVRAEKESQYQYLRTIVHHVAIGIITFDKKGEVQIINAAAKNLLKIDILKNVNQLKELNENLVSSIHDLQTGGRDLIKIERNGEEVQLSIYAIELVQMNKEFKLISIQNIKSELDEKEMDAWQNLIRVLTHEIMNSVTPISSLAATVESELENRMTDYGVELSTLTSEDIDDFYQAVKTIHNRSEGLIKFVSDFRNLTRIPMPKLEGVEVYLLLDNIKNLLKYDIERNNIKLEMQIIPEDLSLYVDKEQIEQVLINLMKNAIQALATDDEKEIKTLDIKAIINEEDKVQISIADNGPGIEEDALKKIFIPFFTTKKSGSGIGLSLSKQILRKHNAIISVNSEINVGSEFLLKFNRHN